MVKVKVKKRTIECRCCNDTGFSNTAKKYVFDSYSMIWLGICPNCDRGMDIVNEEDRYTDFKDFTKKREKL